MNYIVMDLEFNQPFDFLDGNRTILVDTCPFEIVQFGIVRLNEDFKFIDKTNLLVKPEIYNRVHPFVGKITGLTDKSFIGKPNFSETFSQFENLVSGDENVFCLWGTGDMKLLFKNILHYSMPYEKIPTQFINVQSLASAHLNLPAGKSVGLKNAVTALSLRQDIAFHDALNDAIYTARIFEIVDKTNMQINSFNVTNLITEKPPKRHSYNSSALYVHAQKLLGRALSRSEKGVVKKIYELGQHRKYDYDL